MKTLQSLILEATDLCDEEYDTAQWVAWFNAGLDDLAEVLYATKRVTLPSVSVGRFELPDDVKSLIRVDSITKNIKPLTLADDTSIGYRVVDGAIEVQGEEPSSLTLLYYKYPNYFAGSDLTAQVDLNERYANGIVLYACAQGMLREDETERYNLFMSQYLSFKEGVYMMSKKIMPGSTGQIQVIR